MSHEFAMSSWKKNIFSKIPQNKGEGFLLIEPVSSLLVLHQLCLYSLLICRAHGYKPLFIFEGGQDQKYRSIIANYFDDFEVMPMQEISKFKKAWILFVATLYFVRFFFSRNILPAHYKKFHVGPLFYDSYLMMNSMATMHYGDIHLIKSIYHSLRGSEWSHLNIEKAQPKAVLISHRVGVRAGGVLATAKAKGIDVYSIGGQDFGTLYLERDRIRKHYEFTATQEDLKPILSLPEAEFTKIYDSIRERHFRGSFNPDAKLAFSRKLYTSREEFCENFGLDKNKKNAFIMLHAFTDYPHSHFNGMLFNDYFDWFLQTLKFASQDNQVNWIIKQHPSSHFYPIRDHDIKALVEKYKTPNIVFFDSNENIDTRSIAHVGDALITCIGSAGFELSALGGIPSITAGDNPYADAGFAIYPQSREEYFKVLSEISTMGMLPAKERKNAIATYLFVHRLSRVRMSFVPEISHQEQRDLGHSMEYFKKVELGLQKAGIDQVVKDLQKYAQEVASPQFRALRTDPKDYDV